MARDFTKIKAWQFADDLAVLTYDVTRRFPREEIYGLTSQLRRATSSAAANIAEGRIGLARGITFTSSPLLRVHWPK